jgi:hypothetical protein
MKPAKPITRETWRKEQDACHNPECQARYSRGDTMEVHEIIGGSDRRKTVKLPPFWLFLCHACHFDLGSRPSQESLVKQLAWKLWTDLDHYDAKAVIKLWRQKCTEAFVAEIEAAVKAEYAAIVRDFQ